MPRTKTLKASQRNIRSESMIAISPFKLRKHARRRPARTSAKDIREEMETRFSRSEEHGAGRRERSAADARKKTTIWLERPAGFCPLVLVRLRCGGHEIFSTRRFCRPVRRALPEKRP